MKRPRLMIVGHARHGKDCLADYLVEHSGGKLSKRSSSECAIENAIYPRRKEIYVPSVVEHVEFLFDTEGPQAAYDFLYDNRFPHREDWKRLICEYNEEDPCRLMKQLYSTADIYVGIRSLREFKRGKEIGLFDLSIWLENPREGLEETNEVRAHHCDLIMLNDEGLEELNYRAKELIDGLFPLIGRPWLKFNWE